MYFFLKKKDQEKSKILNSGVAIEQHNLVEYLAFILDWNLIGMIMVTFMIRKNYH